MREVRGGLEGVGGGARAVCIGGVGDEDFGRGGQRVRVEGVAEVEGWAVRAGG